MIWEYNLNSISTLSILWKTQWIVAIALNNMQSIAQQTMPINSNSNKWIQSKQWIQAINEQSIK